MSHLDFLSADEFDAATMTTSYIESGVRHTRNNSETSSMVDANDLPDYEFLLSSICDYCRCDDGKISIGLFLEELQRTGIRCTDPRLTYMMKMLDNMKPHSLTNVSVMTLDTGAFRTILTKNTWLINKSFQNQFIIPKFQDFCSDISQIYDMCKANAGGKCSDYIPSLAAAAPETWGVSICTIDGQRYSIGDVEKGFTMQSTSNPLTYAVCLEELGEDLVHKFQGRAPSGRTFNEIALNHQDKPHNPLVNSGAIMSAALILHMVKSEEFGCDMSSKYELVHSYIKRLSGMEYVEFNNTSFIEERNSSDRNFALAHFMKENHAFPKDTNVGRVMDLYFQFSSMEINCESGSLIAATLANGGVCPITGDQVLQPKTVQSVRTLMYGCGMHNNSGKFAFDVGVPAKSGISGCILLVVPNVMGICLWSPPLDTVGNSVRGGEFCKQLVKYYSFHRFESTGVEEEVKKVDPTLRKYENPGAKVMQTLLAAADGCLIFLKRAWFQGIDLNQGDYDNRTPLHLAAAEGHIDCVEFLLKLAKVFPKPLDRWNHTPFDESSANGYKEIAEMISEAIRHWEEDEIKNEGETVDQEYGTFDHAACLGPENAPKDIRISISSATPAPSTEDPDDEPQMSLNDVLKKKRTKEDVLKNQIKRAMECLNVDEVGKGNINAPSTSSMSSNSRRNSAIEEHLSAATRGMQMLNFLTPSLDDYQKAPGSPTGERRRNFLLSSRGPSRSQSRRTSRRNTPRNSNCPSPDRRSVSDEKDNLASTISRDDDNITAPDEDNIF